MEQEVLSLSELNKKIKNCIQDSFPCIYWIIGEISELRLNRNGHCYLELIEKDNLSDKII
ncbi:MAG: exodeoxyribonuclease VII large subunit, partial [Bacteroidia bacterium]|nr:exodeoxyribonuclease VII large subunit [Bacteroidia bacterium]